MSIVYLPYFSIQPAFNEKDVEIVKCRFRPTCKLLLLPLVKESFAEQFLYGTWKFVVNVFFCAFKIVFLWIVV